MFKYDLKIEMMQTKLYKKLMSKAKEFLNTNKILATNSQVSSSSIDRPDS